MGKADLSFAFGGGLCLALAGFGFLVILLFPFFHPSLSYRSR